jgi:O-antigen ligase
MLGLFMVLLLRRRLGLLTVVGLAGAVLLSVTSAETVLQQAVLRGQSVEMFRSLSGRVNWWAPAWEAFRDNPLLGLGGYAAGRFGVLDAIGATEPSSLHNAWLEVLVGVGLVGFLPFLWTVLGTWVTLLRGDPTNAASEVVLALRVEALGVFTLICLRSAFTVEFIWHAPTTFFLILCFAELLRRSRPGVTVPRRGAERLRGMPQPAGLGRPAAVRGTVR